MTWKLIWQQDNQQQNNSARNKFVDANQADAQYTDKNKLDLVVPIRPLANIVKGLQLSILTMGNMRKSAK